MKVPVLLISFVVVAVRPGAVQAVGLVYVDADDGIVTGSPNLSPLGAINSNASLLDSLWGFRGFGSDFSIFESSINADPGAEDSPELTLTVDTGDGLISGNSYDIYVAFWSSAAGWNIRAGLSSGTHTLFNRDGPLTFLPDAVAATPATSVIWSTPPSSCTDAGGAVHSICSAQDDRTMYLGKVGTATATGGQIQVYIDDLPTTDFDPDITPANAVNFRSWLDGVAFIEAGTPLTLEAAINRDDGELTISNNTGAAVSFTSLSITSASQALDAANWTSITDNYDQGGGLDNDAWEITAPTEMPLPGFTGALTEMESAGGSGGATFGTGGPPTSFGNVWNDTRFEDVQVQITLASGETLSVAASYTGTAHLLGDLSNNGSLGLEDYLILSANLHTDVSALGQAEAYLRGDMNGDLLINYTDFAALRDVFPGSGSGSLAALLGEVPEPSAVLLVIVAVIVLSSLRNVRRHLYRPATPAGAVAPTVRSTTYAFDATSSSRTSSMISTRQFRLLAVLAAIAVLPAAETQAINVTMNASDGLGTTSFNAAGNWNNAAPPSAGNDYFTGDFILRTPPDGGNYIFGGNSLTVNNTNGYPQGLLYKGTSNTGVVTIDNLILDGGFVSHANGNGDLFQLAGNINVVSDSTIYAKQGSIDISAAISGTANVTIPQTDAVGETTQRFVNLLGANSMTGNFDVVGKLRLGDAGSMIFDIGASGVNNGVAGSGIAEFNGAFDFDLSGAGTTLGDSWTIANVTTQTFGDTFNVSGFTEAIAGSWVSGIYLFDESTGMLSVAPAPDLLTLRVNTTSGMVSVVNATESASFDMNYYEIRSASASLDTGEWSSIDGDIPATTTTWQKAGGSSMSLISETNLLGMVTLAANDSVSLGNAYAGTLPEHQDLEFFYGTIDSSGTLFRGFIEYVSGGLSGDYNGDGVVDAADYTFWRDRLGGDESAFAPGSRDPSNSGPINQADYAFWVGNFGAHSGSGSGRAANRGSAVPEPSSIVLLLIAACSMTFVHRRSERTVVVYKK